MHKRPLQPIQRSKKFKENCPNRAILDPNHLPQSMTYRPLGRKIKPAKDTENEDAQVAPTAQETNPARSD